MYKSGHMGTSLLLYSPLLYAFIHFEQYALGAVGLFIIISCASLPDLDLKTSYIQHRGYSHSLIGAFVMALPIGIISYYGVTYFNLLLATSESSITASPLLMGLFGFGMGYYAVLTHYAGDIVTPSGIPLLAPYSRTDYSLNWFYAKNKLANGLALTLGLLATAFVIFYPIYQHFTV